jgi:hypothetical protein
LSPLYSEYNIANKRWHKMFSPHYQESISPRPFAAGMTSSRTSE